MRVKEKLLNSIQPYKGYYKKNVSFLQTISKNNNHFSKILLAWNEETNQFLQLTNNKMQFVFFKNYTIIQHYILKIT